MEHLIIVATLCCILAGTSAEREKDCNPTELSFVVRGCQATVIKRIQNSSRSLESCRTSYSQGLNCFNQAMDKCVSHTSGRRAEKIRKSELHVFGEEELFCHYGSLRSIEGVISNLTCRPPVNVSMVQACENAFYTEFRRNASSSKLCNLYKDAHTCQARLLAYCHTSFPMIGFEDPSSAFAIDPFCEDVVDKLEKELELILEGKDHSSSSNVLIPVIVVCSLVFVAMIVGLCYMARKEARNKKASGVTQQKEAAGVQTTANDEPESIPLSSIVTKHDEEITSA